MKKTLQSLVLVLTVAATGMVAQADVIYREIFPNETGGDIPLYESGWEASAASQEDPAYGISSNMGRTTDAEPVNSNYTGTERAKSYAWMSTWGSNAIMYSYEPANLCNTADITTISWYQGNEQDWMSGRAGVKVGGAWYVSATGYTNTAVSSGSFFSTQAEQKTVDLSTAQWNPLVWNGTTLYRTEDVVSLPGGTLQAAALYFESANSGTIRVDTFEIQVVPEPATMGLLAVGGLGLVIRKKR